MSWPEIALGDIAELRNGLNYTKDNEGKGLRVINVKDFGDKSFPNYDELGELNPHGILRDEALLKHGDIVFVRSNGNKDLVGRSLFVDNPPQNVSFSAFCIRARLYDSANPRFYSYFFRTPNFRKRLALLGKGTNISNLNQQVLKMIRIPNPSSAEKFRVVALIRPYDDLIENNRRRIQLLEQATRLLYREWFVHLCFPGHEHVTITDGVPEGWKMVPFPDVVDFKEGPGLRNHQYRDKGIPFLNIRTFKNDEIDLSKTRCIDEMEVDTKYQHFLLEEDDHVVSSSGTLGRLVTVRKCHLPIMLNTSLIRMRPKGAMKKWFLKTYLKYGDFIDQAKSMATGAAQLNYGPSHLKTMSVLIPHYRLVELFEDFAGANYSQIKVLLDSNLQLTLARDLLLPRLMNGEVAV
jgi:type I restriction enzyme S subunit